MSHAPEFDAVAAHKYFAVRCFNGSWQLMGKPVRTPEEDEQLVGLAHASYWHWTQRDECTPKTLSIAYWLLARVYAVVGRPSPAQHYAALALSTAQEADLEPYFIGCGHEAVARAAHLAHDLETYGRALQEARQIAASLSDEKEKKMLLDDLDAIAREPD